MRRPILALLLLAGGSARADTLTLEAALSTAAARQPDVRASRAAAEASHARARQAEAALLPEVDLSGNLLASSGPSNDVLSAENSSRGSLTGSILLWDFGKSSSAWRASQAVAGSADQDARATVLDVNQAVRVAFFNARAAQELVVVAKDTLANEQRHLDQVQAFVDVGKRPEIDLFQERTSLANAQVTLIKADNDYAQAKAVLNQAIGVEAGVGYDLADETLPPVDGEDRSTDELMVEAARARPELAGLALQGVAGERSLDAAKAQRWPALKATTGLDGLAMGDGAPDWGWSAGLALSWPLYTGGRTTAEIAEARASLAQTGARADSLRLSVRLQVEEARLGVVSARAAVVAADEAEKNARERLRLAEGRYAEGVGSAIELGDAQVAETSAAAQKVQAEYSLSVARAQLLRALGRP